MSQCWHSATITKPAHCHFVLSFRAMRITSQMSLACISHSIADAETRALSSHALDALKQFYNERDTHAERFEKLKANADRDAASEEPLSMAAFKEDWNESQFWVSLYPQAVMHQNMNPNECLTSLTRVSTGRLIVVF